MSDIARAVDVFNKKGYKAEFGILVDLVGAKNAEFGLEGSS